VTNPPSAVLQQQAEPVIRAVARACGISYERIVSPTRKAEVADARFVAMLALRRRGWSYPRIAVALNREDHTTIFHGVKRATVIEASDPGFAIAVSMAVTARGE
jgi:chromosomal replication initiation ATPase DnaA